MRAYTVWIGGIEANEYLATKESAEKLANQFIDLGYDDVQIELIDNLESYLLEGV